MRDFKYRAWIKPFTTYKGELVQGRMCKVHSIHFGTKRAIITSEGYGNVSIEFDRIILEEFTGLPDVNEKDIYEGDVLNCGDRVVYVYWNIYCGTWDSQFIRYTKKPLSSNGITPNEWKYRAEVIGNIHENPELLEVTE